MEKKTILIAETNEPQDKLIKDTLIKNNIKVEILDKKIKNGEEMKKAILELSPDIVITNERKKDKSATDIIHEIQNNKKIKQPVFVITSAYSRAVIKELLKEKKITAYSITKPYSFDKLAKNIEKIVETLFS